MSKDLQHWVPWKLTTDLNCRWLYVQDKPFTEPFFDDTISICRRFEENRSIYKSTSTLEMMEEWGSKLNTASPAAIIFHVSRCGSTLLTQLLSCSTGNAVLSEVPFFDELLRIPFKRKEMDPVDIDKYYSAACKLYSQSSQSSHLNLFIKTDSWHLHYHEQLRRIFPGTKFILLYRDPYEVLLSQQRQRGLQSVPGLIEPEVFGFNKEPRNEIDLDCYMAKVLESYYRKMIEICKKDPLVYAYNYADGMLNIAKKIYRVLNQSLTPELEEKWKDRCRFHAKHPKQLFLEGAVKQDQPGYLQLVKNLYQELDTLTNMMFKLPQDKLQ